MAANLNSYNLVNVTLEVFETFSPSWKTEFNSFCKTDASFVDGCSVFQWADYYSNLKIKQLAPEAISPTCELTEFYNFVRLENSPNIAPNCDEERINGLQTFSAVRPIPHTEFVNGVRYGLRCLTVAGPCVFMWKQTSNYRYP